MAFPYSKNKYYLDYDASKGLTTDQLRAAKYNNQFLMSVFTKLVASEGTNPEEAVGDFITCILDNKLPRSDAETGLSSNNLGAKLNFLVTTLRNNPAAQKKFQNSFFYHLINAFRRGSTTFNEQEQWESYQPTSSCSSKYRARGPFAIAMLCHSKDDTAPIGINFATLIDSLIGGDNYGNYYIKTDFDKLGNTAKEMNMACKNYLSTIKSNSAFKQNFTQEGPTTENSTY